MLEIASIDCMVSFMEISAENGDFSLVTSLTRLSMVVLIGKGDSRGRSKG